MDATDLAIYRVFFLDPRVSAERIAKKLGLGANTVRARLKAWHEGGFLQRTKVLPHPALLGLKLGSGSIRVDDVRAKPRVLEDLALVPGALASLDHLGCWMAFSVLGGSDAALERVRRLAAKLPGVDEVTPCRALAPPPPARALRRLDWEILRALRAEPGLPLREAAARVGITPKTFGKRYGALIRDNAALFVPVLDPSRLEGVVARHIILPREGADRGRILSRARALPQLMDPSTRARSSPCPTRSSTCGSTSGTRTPQRRSSARSSSGPRSRRWSSCSRAAEVLHGMAGRSHRGSRGLTCRHG